MTMYRLTRERVQTLVLEVEADSPEQAVKRAYEVDTSAWEDCGGPELAPIDSVGEGGTGRCWGVEYEWLSQTHVLTEVEP